MEKKEKEIVSSNSNISEDEQEFSNCFEKIKEDDFDQYPPSFDAEFSKNEKHETDIFLTLQMTNKNYTEIKSKKIFK